MKKKESKKQREKREEIENREELRHAKESFAWNYLSTTFDLLALQGEITTELKTRLDYELMKLYPNTPRHLR